MSIDWGSVPDWLAGTGAVAALIFARAAARSARDANTAQQAQIQELQQEQRAREEGERRRQASEVAVWVTLQRGSSAFPADPGFDDRPEDELELGARVNNTSTLPIYQLLAIGAVRGEIFSARYSVIGPMTNRRELDRLVTSLQQATMGLPLRDMIVTDEIRVACSFRDAAGHWWCRTAAGELMASSSQENAEDRCRDSVSRQP